MKFIRRQIERWHDHVARQKYLQGVAVPKQSSRLNILLITNSKKNQGFYRDSELLCQTNGVRLTEQFPFDLYDWDIRRVVESIYGTELPDIVYVHYHRHWTWQLKGFDDLGLLKIGFVGDPQDFLDDRDFMVQKKEWFQQAGFQAYMTIAPLHNHMVREGLGDESIPIVDSHLAMDPRLSYPLGLRRKLDISCFGAHTSGKYPFRRQVRRWLESQKELSFNKRQRVRRRANDVEAFSHELNRYRSSFTCASTYGYTVAKYFEIPACGTLLFGEHTPLLESFGFVDGENFVQVSPDDFVEKFHHYLREIHPDDFLAIADAGCKLAHERHTWKVRIRQMVSDFESLLSSYRSGMVTISGHQK